MRFSFVVSLSILILIASSTSQAQAPRRDPLWDGGSRGAGSAPGGSGSASQVADDKRFLQRSLDSGLAAVTLASLAVNKGVSLEVKQFGRKAVDERGGLNDDFNYMAGQLALQMSPAKMSKRDREELNKLNYLSGADFDRELLAYTSDTYRKDLQTLHEESRKVRDPELKHYVEKGVQIVEELTGLLDKNAVSKGQG